MSLTLFLTLLESREVPAATVAYENFSGGLTTLEADLNDDGILDTVAAPMAGGGPHIKVIDGATGAERFSFFAYDSAFRGGVTLAVGDLNGDGRFDIITGTGNGGGPHVRAFSGADGSVLFNAFAYSPDFRGGVFVASADFNSDGLADIVTGAGVGGGPHVRCFGLDERVIDETFLGDTTARNGLRVGARSDDLTSAQLLASTPGTTETLAYRGISNQLVETLPSTLGANAWQLTDDDNRRDIVSQWNDAALRAIRAERTPPPRAARALAILHTAIFDAINAIEGKYDAYLAQPVATVGASPEAAAVEAGYRAAFDLFPTRRADFDRIRAEQLASLAESGKADGLAVGAMAASLILAQRSNDQPVANPYTPGTQPGEWRPTPTTNAAFALPDWGRVTPFTMTRGDEYRPEAPPSLTSNEYAVAFDEVKQIGSVESVTRTAEQTQIALLWAANAGTDTPPGMMNRIAEDIVHRANQSLLESARTFALLNLAMADAGIVAWDAKRLYNWWRPITAIREAETDGNASTVADENWTPLLNTPNHPDYVSGHSTFSSAGAAVLTALFGDAVKVTAWASDLPNVARTFTSIEAAAQEAGLSRIYGGIHTQYANQAGLQSGERLGNSVVSRFLRAKV